METLSKYEACRAADAPRVARGGRGGGRIAALLLLVLLVQMPAALVPPAAAQAVRTLTIRDGEVRIDGRPVPAPQLPASLDVRGLQASYTFSGDVRPVIELNGTLYTLAGRQLAELEPSAEPEGVSVFFRSSGAADVAAAPGLHVQMQAAEPWQAWTGVAPPQRHAQAEAPDAQPPAAFMWRQARALEQQARTVQELGTRLSGEVEGHYVREIDQHADQLRRQARQVMFMAQELPRIEVRHYLDDLQQHDRELYQRLLSERGQEMETIRLAQEIRRLPEGAERAGRVEALRRMLDEIFELKQDNRRREIDQFEARLADLQARLAERERLRSAIIDQRLRELLGDPSNW